jgi:hypothetical protein
MTIHEAEKEARESFRMLRHKSWPHFVPVQSIAGLDLPLVGERATKGKQ